MGFLGNASLNVEKHIGSLNLNSIIKFRVIQREKKLKASLKQFLGRETIDPAYIPLVPSNWGYGHEFWLKKYANYYDDIYATIEHGVYFGNQALGYGNPIHEEWHIGSFITYGSYRKELLSKTYPNNKIYCIGPYIRYAETDEIYKHEILSKIKNGRIITLFPAHSVHTAPRNYDHDKLIDEVNSFANKVDCCNKLVCLKTEDYKTEIIKKYKNENYCIVSCGSDPVTFLPRQRAIFSVSDVTVSNDLGTHVGYSIAMKKPHFAISPVGLDCKDETLVDLDYSVLLEQKNHFAQDFKADTACQISQAQYEFVDYYWGLNIHKTSEEMRDILIQCNEYGKNFSNNKELWVQNKTTYL